MNKKLVFGLSATFFVAGAFWACGSGDVIQYDNNLEGLAKASVEGIGGQEIQEAMALCLQDAACSAEMQSAPDLQPQSSEDVQSSSAATPKSSTGLSWANQSSMAQQPASSMVIVQRSSSSAYVISSGTSTALQSSSSETIVTPGGDVGTCAPQKSEINRGESTVWVMTKNPSLNAQAILTATFDWTFGEDAQPGESHKEKNLSSDAITYGTSGVKNATLVFTSGGKASTMQCSPLQVNGAPITGCKCAAASETVDVAEGGVVTWSIAGCVSSGANVTGYTWGGTGVTGEGTNGTATLAAKGDVAVATVIVANDDNTKTTVECPSVKAVDSNIPDFEIKKTNDKVTFTKSGEFALVVSLPDGWHNQDQYCTLACNGGNSAYSIEIDGITLAGTNYQAAQNKVLVAHTIGGYSMPVTATIPDGESVTCEISW